MFKIIMFMFNIIMKSHYVKIRIRRYFCHSDPVSVVPYAAETHLLLLNRLYICDSSQYQALC